MRLLVAALLAAALLAIPFASAGSKSSLGLSNPTSPAFSALANATTVPITVTIRISPGPACTQGDGTAVVKLTVTTTGAVTSKVDVASISFDVPQTVGVISNPTNPNVPNAGGDYTANHDFNLTVAPNGNGNGTTNVVASFDGNVAGCQGQPDPTNTANPTDTSISTASQSINVTTTTLVSPATPTPSTPTPSTPVNMTTPMSSTPVSSTPTMTTVGDQTQPTPVDTGTPAKKGLPGPEVGLLVAAIAATAVLAIRRK